MSGRIGPGDIVLITGAASGIGRGLAEALHARGALVIAAGRNRTALDAVAAACPGMIAEVVDVADATSVAALAARMAEAHPALNVLINNAGMQQLLDFTGDPPDPAAIAHEIDTNLTGLVQMTAAFLPLLRRQKTARIVQVGSGLGFVPLAAAPVYSATKAAVHSFCISLRHQLRGTGVQVVEIIPPVVETALHRGQSRKPPGAMPLERFVQAALAGLDAGRDEITVGLARVLRVASRALPGLFLRIINKPRN
jgi:uncharacterized oxidoreductase